MTVEDCIAKGNSDLRARCREYNTFINANCTCSVAAWADPSLTPSQRSVAISNCNNETYERYCQALPDNSETQASAQQASAQANQEASSASAATGVVYAAEGVNNLDNNPATAGTLIEAGQKAISTAIGLKEFELKNRALATNIQAIDILPNGPSADDNLVADPKILSSQVADGIFSELEEKYGLSKSDFVEKMLRSRGERNAMWGLFKGNISDEKYSKAFTSADALTKDEKKKIVTSAEAAGLKPEQGNSAEIIVNTAHPRAGSLRDSIRKKLDAMSEKEKEEEAEQESEVGEVPQPDNRMDGLTALSRDDFFGTREPAAEELSIFDIVHRKYRELAEMMEMERGMVLSPLPNDLEQ